MGMVVELGFFDWMVDKQVFVVFQIVPNPERISLDENRIFWQDQIVNLNMVPVRILMDLDKVIKGFETCQIYKRKKR